MSHQSVRDKAADILVREIHKDGSAAGVEVHAGHAFVAKLVETFDDCSTENVQLVKSFALKYITASEQRMAALFEYLLITITTYPPNLDEGVAPSYKRKDGDGNTNHLKGTKFVEPIGSEFPRLAMVKIISNIILSLQELSEDLAAARLHLANVTLFIDEIKLIVEFASFCRSDYGFIVIPQIRNVIQLWSEKAIFQESEVLELRNLVEQQGKVDDSTVSKQYDHWQQLVQRAQISPNLWTLNHKNSQSAHLHPGDPDALWHQAPAANDLVRRMDPDAHRRPLTQPRGLPLILTTGIAAKRAQRTMNMTYGAVKRTLDDFTDTREIDHIDEMGRKVYKDKDRDMHNSYGLAKSKQVKVL